MREEQGLERDDGMPWLPPGVRFWPKDEELLKYYLMPKLMGQRLPCGAIREAEVYEHHPQELLGNDDVAYFFTSRNRKYPNGRRPNRKASGGRWQASSADKDIRKGPIFGRKRNLNYFIDDGTPKGWKTKWLMVEYTIPCSQLPLQDKKLDTWVICKLYVHNRKRNPNGREAVPEDLEIGSSSSHSVVHEDAKGPTEISNLQQDMITGRQVQMLPSHSNHANELVNLPYHPPYANRDMVMPNYMPLHAVAWTAQYDPSMLDVRSLDSQPDPVILPPLPSSSFIGYAEAEASTTYARATTLMSTPPSDFYATWPWHFDSELLEITKVLEDNYVPPQSVLQTKQYDPSRLDQGPSDSQPPVILAPLPPFIGYAEAESSTSHARAIMSISTSPPDFSATWPQHSDLELQEISKVLKDNYVPRQLVLQTKQCDPSRLNEGSLDSQLPIVLAPLPPFTEDAEVGPSTSYIMSMSTPPSDFSATVLEFFDS